MSSNSTADSGVSRRGFLMGSLAGAVTLTAVGTTGLRLASSPANAGEGFVADVTGNYRFTDPGTGCRVTVTVQDGVRRIRANGLPNHTHGTFPNAAVSAQDYDYSLDARPRKASSRTDLVIPQPFGIAINGVPFDPLAAEWWNRDPSSGWQYNALSGAVPLFLDSSEAHVQPTGAYHYHGVPKGLRDSLAASRHSPLLGWAGDGFPIYLDRGYRKPRRSSSGLKRLRSSYQLRTGTRPDGPGGRYNGDFLRDYVYRPGHGDLDASNGRFQVTPEYPAGTYCYVLTRTFPVIPLSFAGTLAANFHKAGPTAPR